MSARLLPAVRHRLSEHPRAVRLSPEQVAGLLWILRHVPDGEGPPEPFEVAGVMGILDVERGAAA
jgi:hypothetical protein